MTIDIMALDWEKVGTFILAILGMLGVGKVGYSAVKRQISKDKLAAAEDGVAIGYLEAVTKECSQHRADAKLFHDLYFAEKEARMMQEVVIARHQFALEQQAERLKGLEDQVTLLTKKRVRERPEEKKEMSDFAPFVDSEKGDLDR